MIACTVKSYLAPFVRPKTVYVFGEPLIAILLLRAPNFGFSTVLSKEIFALIKIPQNSPSGFVQLRMTLSFFPSAVKLTGLPGVTTLLEEDNSTLPEQICAELSLKLLSRVLTVNE